MAFYTVAKVIGSITETDAPQQIVSSQQADSESQKSFKLNLPGTIRINKQIPRRLHFK